MSSPYSNESHSDRGTSPGFFPTAADAKADRSAGSLALPIATEDPPIGISVAIVAICSEAHLARCLETLSLQRGAPPFEIVIASAARLGPLCPIAARFPSVRLLPAAGRQSPIELAASAVSESHGSVVLLTEDHCTASHDWVRALSEAVVRHRRTIGGSLDPLPALHGFDWAFYFVDFFRYMLPRDGGPTASVSVCNVGYMRSDLLQLGGDWRDAFHETRVHDELMRRHGAHVFEPDARMHTGRMVGYGDGHRERYSFGRMFAAGRINPSDRVQRALYAAGTAVLPALLLGRMGAHAFRQPSTTGRFVRALPHIVTLVLAWSWGEFLGYATATPPRNADAARER